MVLLFDIEGNGLLNTITKLHCLSYCNGKIGSKIRTTHDYDEMRKLLTEATILIGHNIVTFDIPAAEKILNIRIKAKLIDTLALSWYLNVKRNIHGLDSFGKEYGVNKPKIDDWEGLTPKEYAFRCEEDVKINLFLWQDLKSRLLELYSSRKDADRLIDYLTFKMDCIREQESSKWKFNRTLAEESRDTLEQQQKEKLVELISIMPEKINTISKVKPKNCFKKDGTLSVYGCKWQALLKDNNLSPDFDGEVIVETSPTPANPNSPEQVKEWLFSLGWNPCTFKYVKEDDGERSIPQVRKDGELAPSVKLLIDKEKGVGVLDGLTVIQHRLGIFKGFLKDDQDGWLVAGMAGFTNTLRLKHRGLVNLPGVDKPWGKEIRGCLVAPKGMLLCGSDMVSLEDTTKKHYMYPYDPEYVEEMSKDGFDAHLDLAKHAGVVTQEEIDAYVNKIEGAKNLKAIRRNYKAANYSCVYGVGGPKLSRETGLSLREGTALRDAYWKRNWAVEALAKDQEIKTVKGQMWLKNPVSGFWYSLRFKKDIFSTLNQGTGVYCFDMWIKEWRKQRSQLTGQFHDEIIACLKPKFKERYESLLRSSIKKVNELLKLNVELDVDVQFGKTYAEIH